MLRQVVGVIASFDGMGNIVVNNATEVRQRSAQMFEALGNSGSSCSLSSNMGVVGAIKQ
jgi:small nuclear ribonucleoprotein (snRNP)-like protein